jgi:Calcineurin-like phosphoesterase
MKLKLFFAVIILLTINSCKPHKQISSSEKNIEVSFITNKSPYNPKPGMENLRRENEIKLSGGKVKLKKPMHFLVFGDSKGSLFLKDVLKRADILNPQFCLTTADLVDKGAGEIGVNDYKKLDSVAGWFFRKYPTWPTLGNHEVKGTKNKSKEENNKSGQKNFADFFGLKNPTYSFTYGNSVFIALDWEKVSKSPKKLAWLEKELKDAQGKHIFIFKHRPYYTVGLKSYEDVEGKSTIVTKLFSKYKVSAVFSGHDHLYYRTIRDGVNYIISSGAGAYIYDLRREKDTIPGDVYYGRLKKDSDKFKFHSSSNEEVFFNKAVYFVISVKVNGKKITFEMIDTEGKIWDTFTFESDI